MLKQEEGNPCAAWENQGKSAAFELHLTKVDLISREVLELKQITNQHMGTEKASASVDAFRAL